MAYIPFTPSTELQVNPGGAAGLVPTLPNPPLVATGNVTVVHSEKRLKRPYPFPLIVAKVMDEPWLITPGGHAAIMRILESRMVGVELTAFSEEDMEVPGVKGILDADGIGVVPISGTLGMRLSGVEKMCGGTDYLDIQRATDEMLGQGAKGILYAIDSPGGMVRGCQDLATYIQGLPVPTEAYTDTKATSAAYWLATACNHITATGTSDLGSIGVILPFIDRTKVWETEGIKYDPITNAGADLKGMGGGPNLTAEQRENIQQSADYVGKQFHDFVNSQRKVDKEVFRAGTYFGSQALAVGLADTVGGFTVAHDSLVKRVRSRVPETSYTYGKQTIQGSSKMTLEELKSNHPDLYNQMQEANQAAALAAETAARGAERERLAALDELSFNADCKELVAAAKADGRKASKIAVQIAKMVAAENESLRTQVGVLKGANPGAKVAGIDPTTTIPKTSAQELPSKLAAAFTKRMNQTATSRN